MNTELERTVCSKKSTPTILCVDDDLDILGAIEFRLRNFDVNLVRALDGMEGFGEALTYKPDVILMDLDMPYGDGMTMLECFRRDAKTQSTPIIILTGMRDPALKQELIGMGANQFLQKPIQFDNLMRELSRFINLRERVHDAKPREEHDDDQPRGSWAWMTTENSQNGEACAAIENPSLPA